MEYLSSSRINLYLMCPLKYKFHYVDQLPKPFRPSALAFGSAIHSAINWYHKEGMNGNSVTLDKLCKIFDADWYVQKTEADIHFKDTESPLILSSLGKAMLGLYFQNPVREVKGSEVPFTVPLVNPDTGKGPGKIWRASSISSRRMIRSSSSKPRPR